nr:FG-GAP-like repeat-containing protein [Vibrio sp. RE86]
MKKQTLSILALSSCFTHALASQVGFINGDITLESRQLLSATDNSTSSVSVADIDGDGIEDIIATVYKAERDQAYSDNNKQHDEIVYFKGQGNGSFASVKQILSCDNMGEVTTRPSYDSRETHCDSGTNAIFSPYDLVIGDFVTSSGSLGKEDILVSSLFRQGVQVVTNRGDTDNDGDFTDNVTETIENISVQEQVRQIAYGDINGDSHLDYAVVYGHPTNYTFSPSSGVEWYKGDGSGGFTLGATIKNVSYGGYQFARPETIEIEDIDGDGLLDIAVGFLSDANSNDKTGLIWFKQSRSGSMVNWTEIDVSNANDTSNDRGIFTSIAITDINNDSRNDLIAVNNDSDYIYYWLGTSGTASAYLASSPQKVDVSALTSNSVTALTALTANDLDHDGDIDLVVSATQVVADYESAASASNDKLSMYLLENKLVQTSSLQFKNNKIESQKHAISKIAAHDFDNNGVVDLVANSFRTFGSNDSSSGRVSLNSQTSSTERKTVSTYQLAKSLTLSISEGSTVIDTISTSDDNQVQSYALSGTHANHFAISPSGVISPKAELDYESGTTSYNFNVEATLIDSSTIELPTTVRLTNVNEPAEFNQVHDKITIDIGTTPVNIDASAIDPDGDSVTYSLSATPSGANLSISATGIITATTPAEGSYEVTVSAVSNGLTSSMTFTLILAFDTDNDGMYDYWENLYGLNPNDPSDAALDTDQDGLSNLDEFYDGLDPTTDDIAPEFHHATAAPGSEFLITINADNLFTEVDLGEWSVVDVHDGAIDPLLISYDDHSAEIISTWEQIQILRPGEHAFKLSASDAAGNLAEQEIRVVIYPLIEFYLDQVVAEGDKGLRVTAELNGPLPCSPCSIDVPFNYDNSADNSATLNTDFTEVSGPAVFGYFTFTDSKTIDHAEFDSSSVDGDSGDETITLIFDPSASNPIENELNLNIGPKSSHTITLSESNIASKLALTSTVNSVETSFIDDGLEVAVSARITNGAADDVTWFYPEELGAIVSGDNSRITFTTGSVRGEDPIEIRAELTTTGETLSTTLHLYPITNEDGHIEDHNNNLVLDYLESNLPSFAVALNDSHSNKFIVQSNIGTQIRLGTMAAAEQKAGIGLDDDAIAQYGIPAPDNYLLEHGLIDFEVHNIAEAGDSVSIVIPQAEPVVMEATLKKYSLTKGWYDFVEDEQNSVLATLGQSGFCPPPGDASYNRKPMAGDWCIQLTIQDGGPNDDDGSANGRIIDPNGFVTPIPLDKELPIDEQHFIYVSAGHFPWIIMALLTVMVAARKRQLKKSR